MTGYPLRALRYRGGEGVRWSHASRWIINRLLRAVLGPHPAKDAAQLTPRLWKEKFAENPMRSDVDRVGASETCAGEGDADY